MYPPQIRTNHAAEARAVMMSSESDVGTLRNGRTSETMQHRALYSQPRILHAAIAKYYEEIAGMVLARNQEMNLTGLTEFEVLDLHAASLNRSLIPSVLFCACPVLEILAQYVIVVACKHSSEQSHAVLVHPAPAHSNFPPRCNTPAVPF